MNKPKKKDIMNLFFSAFLIIGFVVCAYFLLGLIKDSFQDNAAAQTICKGMIFALFGAILFYATRVGDGKQVWRFSAASLILVVIPSLYILLAPVIPGMPLGTELASRPEIIALAGVAFGYGIPYTFLSGYELDRSDSTDNNKEPLSAEDELSDESTGSVNGSGLTEDTQEDGEVQEGFEEEPDNDSY